MNLKDIYENWRHSALHATLVIRSVTPFNNAQRDVIKMNNTVKEEIKMHGISGDGVEIYINVELLGRPETLQKYNFTQGGHAAFVLRLID